MQIDLAVHFARWLVKRRENEFSYRSLLSPLEEVRQELGKQSLIYNQIDESWFVNPELAAELNIDPSLLTESDRYVLARLETLNRILGQG